MEKKSLETRIESELQPDNVWKSKATVKLEVEDDTEYKVSSYEVMSFEDDYDKSVSVVSFAVYRFLSEDLDKDDNWTVTKKEKTNE